MPLHEKSYIVDPTTGALCDGFYITREQDAIKVANGRAYVNGVETKLRIGETGIRVDEQKYNRTIRRRFSGLEHTDAMTAEPPSF